MIEQAKALLAANDLDGAIAAVISHVKGKPTDMTARTFLFELLVFAGEFDRAGKQLDVLGQQDAGALLGTQIYRECMAAETARRKVFAGEILPQFITHKPAHAELLLDAVRALKTGDAAAAREKLDQNETQRPAIGGKMNGSQDFEDCRDYNDLTASVLEIILKGEYIWLPFESVKKLEFTAPKTLRDRFWRQANVELLDGSGGEIHLPALYHDSFKHADGEIRLGKATDWTEHGDDVFSGVGARLLAVGGAAQPFAEIETLEFVIAE